MGTSRPYDGAVWLLSNNACLSLGGCLMLISESDLVDLMNFAYRVAHAYARRWDPEYQSIAHWAMLRAIKSYDETRGVPLKGWVAFRVRRGLQWFWRRNKRYKLQSNLFWEELAEPAQQPDGEAWNCLNELSEFDRLVATAYWIDGLTIKQIAERLKQHGVVAKRLGTYMGKLKARIWAMREKLKC